MTELKAALKIHPTEAELSGFLDNSLSADNKSRIEEHIAMCKDCLETIVSAHESVKLCERGGVKKKGKVNIMKKINLYLVFAILSFILSFSMPRYFIQFLVATLLLGIKWIVDSKSTKMLIMIYEAWKKGGEKEASRVLHALNSDPKNRL